MKEPKTLLTKALIGVALVASTSLSSSAQISFGGEPASFSQPVRSANALRSTSGSKVIEVLPNFNTDDVRATNQWDINQLHVKPLVIGQAIDTNIDFARDAERITLDNGLVVYRLVIDTKGALSNVLYYDDFLFPKTEESSISIHLIMKPCLANSLMRLTPPTGLLQPLRYPDR